jgi:hypothetical protein
MTDGTKTGPHDRRSSCYAGATMLSMFLVPASKSPRVLDRGPQNRRGHATTRRVTL